MSIIDDIRQRISNAILPSAKRLQRPYGSRGYKQSTSIPTGNELTMSLRGTVFACLQHRANALSAIQFNYFTIVPYPPLLVLVLNQLQSSSL